MRYYLSETEINQIKVWLTMLPEYYSEQDAAKLLGIFQKAIVSANLESNDVYELLEYLPRMIPKVYEETNCPKEEQNYDWHVNLDMKKANYRREIKKLFQLLSNWIFLQNAHCCKNRETVEQPKDKFQALGIM